MGLEPQGLYHPENEHDACGVGFVANIKGRKSHTIVEQGLTVLKNLTHRGAVGWDPKLSDGAGLLIQIPDRFYRDHHPSGIGHRREPPVCRIDAEGHDAVVPAVRHVDKIARRRDFDLGR